MVFELSSTNSIANHFIAELRDKKVQIDRLRFRRNLERLGEVLAYEVSKELSYTKEEIQTVLGVKQSDLLDEQPVILTILRAGLPFFNGVTNYFEYADAGFIGAYRVEEDGGVEIKADYQAKPSVTDKEVIIVDPMLATGKSLVASVDMIAQTGAPKMVHIIAAIAAPEGIAYLKQHLNCPFKIWVGAIDERLDENAYIVPGLGDAGDLSYGPKI